MNRNQEKKMVSGSIELNLSLSLKHSYVPKSLTDLLKDLSKIEIFGDRLMALNDYLHNHAQELSTLDGFKDQVPQCMLLLIDAIEALKAEVMKPKKITGSDSNELFLMDFLAMKRRAYEAMKKENNPNPEKQTVYQKALCSSSEAEVAEGSSARMTIAAPPSWQPMASKPIISRPEPYYKGYRRIWTKELQARFLRAIQYLGGPEVATPRKIRDIMEVQGLTTEQVKSHLQKYRRHCKKVLAAQQSEVGVPEESVGENQIPSDVYLNVQGFTTKVREMEADTSCCCSTNQK